jgi:anti-sigma B factor antagonist
MSRIQLAINAHEPYPGLKVAVLTGGLTIETVALFNHTLREDPAPVLLLNLSKLDWLDSAGVGSLVQLMVRREKAKTTLAIADLTTRNQAVLQVSQLLRLFRVFQTTDQAVEYFAHRGGFTSKTKLESA